MNSRRLSVGVAACLIGFGVASLRASTADAPEPADGAQRTGVPKDAAEFQRWARERREASVGNLFPAVHIVKANRSDPGGTWKTAVLSAVFWVGAKEKGSSAKGATAASAWDKDWVRSFGGTDDPRHRHDYLPRDFVPKLNPFYVALPYNDIGRNGTKEEARRLIPWYARTFMEDGVSVCRNHWMAIRNPANGEICYAQWSDCGPGRTDHWQYVFGDERPSAGKAAGVGLSISPAVRDYLGMGDRAYLDWRFVEVAEVPKGPWRQYGANNPFVQWQEAAAKRETRRE